MLAMNSTLLVGPSDWDSARIPKTEFAARAGAFWRDNPPASGAIVYGDRESEDALAVRARGGEQSTRSLDELVKELAASL